MKDDMIWKLVDEKKKKDTDLKHKFDSETRKEMNQWVELVDNFAGELKRYQLVCSFCGVHLDENSVNFDCSKNPMITDPSMFNPPLQLFTTHQPAQEFYSTGRHFFSGPNERLFNEF